MVAPRGFRSAASVSATITARTFGSVRVGHAEAFLRADDEAALTELLHHPKAGPLGLRRLAPTVLISTAPLDVLLPRLRDLGAAIPEPKLNAANAAASAACGGSDLGFLLDPLPCRYDPATDAAA